MNGTLRKMEHYNRQMLCMEVGKKLGDLSLMMIRLQGNILILNWKQLYQAVVKEQAVPF